MRRFFYNVGPFGLGETAAMLIIPSHVHVPDPHYLKLLDGKRVFLDVGTLLRGLLFRESHAARLLEHIERVRTAIAITSPHVRDLALRKAEGVGSGHVLASGLLAFIQRKVIELGANGDASALPIEARFDPADDDIVTASAVANHCHFLATLDRNLARHARHVIAILPPSQPECSTLLIVGIEPNFFPPLYFDGREGSLFLEIMPSEGSTNYGGSGRRYVWYSESGWGLWLSEKTWRFQIGMQEPAIPAFEFPHVDLSQHCLIGISYDCATAHAIVGFASRSARAPFSSQVPNSTLPDTLGDRFNLLSRGEQDDGFMGYWRAALSSKKFIGHAAMNYALKHNSYFEPLDAQRYKLEDGLMHNALLTAVDFPDLQH